MNHQSEGKRQTFMPMHIDFTQLQLPDVQHRIVQNGNLSKDKDETPWQWYGYFKDNPLSERLFDEAEEERDKHWIGGTEDDTAVAE